MLLSGILGLIILVLIVVASSEKTESIIEQSEE